MRKILAPLAASTIGIFLIWIGVTTLQQSQNRPKVIIGGNTVYVDIARTPQEQQRGLSGRANLPKDHGMLFIFRTKGYYPFWMKDMRFPIDIIWIADNQVVLVSPHLPAPLPDQSYLPTVAASEPVNYVLEVPSDFAKHHAITKSTHVEIVL